MYEELSVLLRGRDANEDIDIDRVEIPYKYSLLYPLHSYDVGDDRGIPVTLRVLTLCIGRQ